MWGRKLLVSVGTIAFLLLLVWGVTLIPKPMNNVQKVALGEEFEFREKGDVVEAGPLALTLIEQGVIREHKIDGEQRIFGTRFYIQKGTENGVRSEAMLNGEQSILQFDGLIIRFLPRIEQAPKFVVRQLLKNYPSVSDDPFMAISELRAKNPDSGKYNIEGYVRSAYICPPCPEGAVCKPCVGEYIVITEKKKADIGALAPDTDISLSPLTSEIKSAGEDEVILFVGSASEFMPDSHKYRFSIEAQGTNTLGKDVSGGMNDLNVIGYDEIQ